MNRTMIFVVIALAGCEGDLSHPDFPDAGTVSAVPGGRNSWKHAGADALVKKDAGGKSDILSADDAGARASDSSSVQSSDSNQEQEADSEGGLSDARSAQAADGYAATPADSSAVSSDEGSGTDDSGKPCICKCKGKGNCCGCKCKKKSPACPTCKSHSYNN